MVEPSRSLVLRKPTLTISHGGGQKLEGGSADFQLLADWIASGARGPRDDDPRLERLEVFPSHAVLQPKDTLQILVRGHYSDGRMEDVTRWVKFNSTEDQVAAVRRSALQWEFIDDLARKVDRKALNEARAHADAVEGYRIVYEMLGLDKAYTERIIARHKG